MPVINSIEDLKRLREEAQKVKEMKDKTGKTEVIVGMGTVGIAAGARETLKAILEYIEDNKLPNIILRQTGNPGFESADPVVQVVLPDGEKVSYGKVTPVVATRIMDEHVRKGNVLTEYVIKA